MVSISFVPYYNPAGCITWIMLPHVTEEETETQEQELTWPSSHSSIESVLGAETSKLTSSLGHLQMVRQQNEHGAILTWALEPGSLSVKPWSAAASCANLAKWFHLSVPWLPHLQNGDRIKSAGWRRFKDSLQCFARLLNVSLSTLSSVFLRTVLSLVPRSW